MFFSFEDNLHLGFSKAGLEPSVLLRLFIQSFVCLLVCVCNMTLSGSHSTLRSF